MKQLLLLVMLMFLSKLDLSPAFMQLPIDLFSQEYLVINTSEGLYKFQCLPFGLSVSPGIFPSCITKVLANVCQRILTVIINS